MADAYAAWTVSVEAHHQLRRSLGPVQTRLHKQTEELDRNAARADALRAELRELQGQLQARKDRLAASCAEVVHTASLTPY